MMALAGIICGDRQYHMKEDLKEYARSASVSFNLHRLIPDPSLPKLSLAKSLSTTALISKTLQQKKQHHYLERHQEYISDKSLEETVSDSTTWNSP